jgi:rare lipoprotein A
LKKFIFLSLFVPFFGIAQQTTKASGKPLKGFATIYANRFIGLRTATGEIFKHSNLTAASNNFKINSWVKVTNLSNMKSVIVRINDRMHPRMARMGRLVDLTKAAAKLLGNFDGIVGVKVETITDPIASSAKLESSTDAIASSED